MDGSNEYEYLNRAMEEDYNTELVRRNIGKWKKGDMPTYGGWKCSVCKKNTVEHNSKFCPNCGARMK